MIDNIRCMIDNNEDEMVYNRSDFDGVRVTRPDGESVPFWQGLCEILDINPNANTIIIGAKSIKGVMAIIGKINRS